MGNFDAVPEDILDAGEDIVGPSPYVGKYKPTGKTIRAQFAHVWTLSEGKVTRWRQYVDTKQFADAMIA